MPKYHPASRCGASLFGATMHKKNAGIPGASPFEIYRTLHNGLLGPIAKAHLAEQLEAEFAKRGWMHLDNRTPSAASASVGETPPAGPAYDGGPVRGNTIVLHRRYCPPDCPESEAGPAAIIDRTPQDWYSVARCVNRLESGTVLPWEDLGSWVWLGVQPGRRQAVKIVSPWIPPLHRHSSALDWRTLSGFTPGSEVAAVVVWMPRRLFPGQSLPQVASRLLCQWFVTAGAVYEAEQLGRV